MTTAPQAAPLRITIVGSCVSRDTVEARDPQSYALVRYMARNSTISVDTNARGHLPEDLAMDSPFQQRQLELDAEGDLRQVLTYLEPETDLLLWDLCDERHGVVRYPDGSYLTRSIDILGNEALKTCLEDGEAIAFGSDQHFHRWQLAADRFVGFLREEKLLSRTLVLAVDWAERTTQGKTTPWSMGTKPREANLLYARYYDHLRSLGLPLVVVDEPLADPDHRWGLAAFHYTPEVYAQMNAAIDEFTARDGQE